MGYRFTPQTGHSLVEYKHRVRIELINGDGLAHDLALPDLARQTALITGKGKHASVTFAATAGGVYAYICTVAGHRQAGMEGRLVVTP